MADFCSATLAGTSAAVDNTGLIEAATKENDNGIFRDLLPVED